MSRASTAFLDSIKDAEELLQHFDAINTQPPPPNAEVLKRAGLIMALTAWESYVEDRASEALDERIAVLSGSPIAEFVSKRFQEEVKRLHSPTAGNTHRLFHDYLGVDPTTLWEWPGSDLTKTKQTLNDLIQKRGSAAHRSRATIAKSQNGHLVKRDDLEKAIRFLKSLVEKTEEALRKA